MAIAVLWQGQDSVNRQRIPGFQCAIPRADWSQGLAEEQLSHAVTSSPAGSLLEGDRLHLFKEITRLQSPNWSRQRMLGANNQLIFDSSMALSAPDLTEHRAEPWQFSLDQFVRCLLQLRLLQNFQVLFSVLKREHNCVNLLEQFSMPIIFKGSLGLLWLQCRGGGRRALTPLQWPQSLPSTSDVFAEQQPRCVWSLRCAENWASTWSCSQKQATSRLSHPSVRSSSSCPGNQH